MKFLPIAKGDGEGDRVKRGGGGTAPFALHRPSDGPPPHEAAPHREELTSFIAG
jgi:hypothetical protein